MDHHLHRQRRIFSFLSITKCTPDWKPCCSVWVVVFFCCLFWASASSDRKQQQKNTHTQGNEGMGRKQNYSSLAIRKITEKQNTEHGFLSLALSHHLLLFPHSHLGFSLLWKLLCSLVFLVSVQRVCFVCGIHERERPEMENGFFSPHFILSNSFYIKSMKTGFSENNSAKFRNALCTPVFI